ncbi:MAG: tripartite tricarboxylate transporter substrate binding protein [Betaproteobacteria bacterium]|nr:tripartite tricarboxylate transporter substrate binding protein [Betaproteobacteria bacterium]
MQKLLSTYSIQALLQRILGKSATRPGLGRARALHAVSMLLGLSLAQLAAAQNYPDKPIRVVVPFAAGGGADFFARPMGQKLTESLGQPILIDNRGGANGAIGAEVVMRAAPDGYTLLFGSAGVMTIGPALNSTLKYDTERDFVPVALIVDSPFSLIVHPSIGVKSLKDLIAYARSNPGKLRYGSSGIGGAPHLAGELFNDVAKTDMVHVAYKGVGPMAIDLLGGHIDLTFIGLNIVQQHVSAGKLLVLATTGEKRSPLAPDLPTMSEAGLPGFKAGTWYGVLAPVGTPRAIVAKLNTEINRIFRQPDMRNLLAKTGAEPSGNTPEQFAAFMKAERQKWDKLARTANIRLE